MKTTKLLVTEDEYYPMYRLVTHGVCARICEVDAEFAARYDKMWAEFTALGRQLAELYATGREPTDDARCVICGDYLTQTYHLAEDGPLCSAACYGENEMYKAAEEKCDEASPT